MNNKYKNLKPWPPGQSGNPSGRKPGSKNISTIARELLEQDADNTMLTKSSIGEFIQGKPTSYAKAMVLAMIQKAIQGNVQAASWLVEQQRQDSFAVEQVRIEEQPVIISVINPRTQSAVD